MPPGIGYGRDIPLAGEQSGATPQGGTNVGGMSPQEAVKILSLRVPERPSASAIAPLPLLQSQGGMAPGAGGLDSMIAALMQAFPQLGRGPAPQTPTFGGPGTPSQRPGARESKPAGRVEVPPMQPPAAPPPPRVTPGEGAAPAPPPLFDTGGPTGDGGRTDLVPLPLQELPLTGPPPGRGPFDRHMDLFGQDIQSLF